jgi:hypothetical protein
MEENKASADISYTRGTCPSLDDLSSRTMLLCIASNLTQRDVNDIIAAYRKVTAVVCKCGNDNTMNNALPAQNKMRKSAFT